MGWAKYYEDNLSIMNNRLTFTYAEKEEPLYQVRPSIHEAVKVAPSRKRDRAELKIHFTGGDNRIAARKLQINGWWWSKLNNCWCNYNTAINRAFAEHIQRKMDPTNAVEFSLAMSIIEDIEQEEREQEKDSFWEDDDDELFDNDCDDDSEGWL